MTLGPPDEVRQLGKDFVALEDRFQPREWCLFHSPDGVRGWPGVLRVGFLKRIEALRSCFAPVKDAAPNAPGLTRTFF